MKKTISLTIALIALAIITISLTNLALAVTIKSVTAQTFTPGQDGDIIIEIENNLDKKAKDLSVSLDLKNLPFIPIGSSEDSISELDEEEEEEFIFKIKSANDIKPGDYEIPYAIRYAIDNEQRSRSGSIGIKVQASPDLTFTLSTEKPIIGIQDKISLKIINKGFADARFVSVKILPLGLTLLSDDEVYIGTINSDDFETADFEVIYQTNTLRFFAIIEYKDFNNKKITQNINIPITVYTEEKALELGLIEKSNTALYIITAITLILIWTLYRTIRKNSRLKRLSRKKDV